MNGYKDGLHDDFEEITIPVPWGHISGKWWGSKDVQPIIAIHGWQDNAGTFDKLAPKLKDSGFSVFCIDLPGHGLSSHLPPGHCYYLFWDGLHIVRRIVKHFKWTKVTLMGHSLGGAISFLYAGTFPKEVEKYICIDIASPSVRNMSKLVEQAGDALDKFLKYETLTKNQHPCYEYEDMISIVQEAYKDNLDREGCEIMMRRGMKKAKDRKGYYFSRDVRLKASAMGFMSLDQILEFASKTICEVLNIRGHPGHKFDHPEHYDIVLEKLSKTAKKVERHIIPGTHHLHLNDADTVAPIIIKFLKS
ncbi:probable serine hydrolase [Agrilus planipennis]|uniref:Probable serine hydrolase n=1 Tax=Agrilus planipennis TaxID=224129 RepID=A0A1W4WGQ0_AGRPL|nr:probable serine hydrolase [Agrilus planipennis]